METIKHKKNVFVQLLKMLLSNCHEVVGVSTMIAVGGSKN